MNDLISHQITRLNYLFKILWLQINEPKCYRMYVTLINHDIKNYRYIHNQRNILSVFREYENISNGN